MDLERFVGRCLTCRKVMKMKKLALLALLICVGVVGCEDKKPATGSGAGSAAPTATGTK